MPATPHTRTNPCGQAEKFEKTGRQIRKNLWWQNVKLKVALLIVVLVILGIIALAIYVAVRR